MSGDGFRAEHHITVKAQDLQRGHKSQSSPTGTLTPGDPMEHQRDMVQSLEMALETVGICNGSASTVGSGPQKWWLWGHLRSFCQTSCFPDPQTSSEAQRRVPNRAIPYPNTTWTKLPQKQSSIPVVPLRLEHLTTCSPVAPRGSVLSFLFNVPAAFHTALIWGPITLVTFSNQKVQPREV